MSGGLLKPIKFNLWAGNYVPPFIFCKEKECKPIVSIYTLSGAPKKRDSFCYLSFLILLIY